MPPLQQESSRCTFSALLRSLSGQGFRNGFGQAWHELERKGSNLDDHEGKLTPKTSPQLKDCQTGRPLGDLVYRVPRYKDFWPKNDLVRMSHRKR